MTSFYPPGSVSAPAAARHPAAGRPLSRPFRLLAALLGTLLLPLLAVAQVPTITTFTPGSGPLGVTIVTITGTNFTGATAVKISGFSAPRFVVNSATSITAVVSMSAYTGPLTVTTPTGTATAPTNFTEIVTSVVRTLSPVPHSLSADTTEEIVGKLKSLSYPLQSSVNTMRVYGEQRGGRKRGSAAGSAGEVVFDAVVNRDPAYAAGEQVSVSLPNTILQNSVGLAKQTYRFHIKAGGGTGVFTAATAAVGSSTSAAAVAVGDVDGDNYLDVLTGSAAAATVGVARTLGSLTYAGASTVAVGGVPTVLRLADIDNDHDLDLISSSQTSNAVSVLYNSNGTFGTATNLTVSAPIEMETGDVDADGDLDVVVLGSGGTVTVLLNNGTGTFAAAATLNVGATPRTLALADVDTDGALDLLVSADLAPAAGTVTTYLNNRDGVFALAPTSPVVTVGVNPVALTVGDVDNDGDLDLLTANQGGTTVSVRLNNGFGTFGGTTEISLGAAPADVALLDTDADGDFDLVASCPAANVVQVALNAGGTFGTTTSLGVAGNPTTLVAADLDRDRDVDFLVGTTAGARPCANANRLPTISGFTPTSGPSGTSVVITGTNLLTTSSVLFDGIAATSFTVNSDTQITARVPVGTSPAVLTVSNFWGTTTSAGVFTPTFEITGINPSRYDADISRTTSLTATFSETVGTSTFTEARVYGSMTYGLKPLTITQSGTTLTLDPTTDFKAGEELTVTLPRSIRNTRNQQVAKPRVYRYRAAAAGTGYLNPALTSVAATAPRAVTSGDVNNDGTLDLVAVSSASPSRVTVRLNNGSGVFSGTAAFNVAPFAQQAELADVDGDGDLDLLIVYSGGGAVSVHKNDGSGSFTAYSPVYYPMGSGATALAVGDLNADGWLDIVTADNLANTVSVSFNNGDGTFGTATAYPVGNAPAGVALGDLDLDYDLDVVVTNSADNTFSRLLNDGTGALGPQTTYPTGTNPTAVVVTNLNDFFVYPEVIVVNTGDNTVLYYEGRSGGLGLEQTLAVGSLPRSVAVADVDGNGVLDLVVTNGGSNSLTYWLFSGLNQFNVSRTVATGTGPISVTLADLDGDHDLDALVANQTGGLVSVHLNSYPTPVISSFAPTSGPEGTPVTLAGQNLADATVVKFNGVSATISAQTTTSLTTTVPVGASTGPVSVTNAVGTGTSALSFQVVPGITSFSPAAGVVGTSVVLTGSQFAGATAVAFNGVAATAFTVNSATQLTVTVPVGASSGSITVTTAAGTGTSTTSFLVPPTISSFTPTSGTFGTSVVITGSQFTGATAVSFGGVAAAAFTVNSDTQLTATVAGASQATSGNVFIAVTTPSGTTTSAGTFAMQLLTPVALSPARNARSAAVSTNVSATLSEVPTPASFSNLRVFSTQHGGLRAGQYSASGATLTFDPTADFVAGEKLTANLTSSLVGSVTGRRARHQWQFNAAAQAGSGTFLNACNLTASHTTGGTTYSVRATTPVDVDGDGDLDLVAITGKSVQVVTNNGCGSFTKTLPAIEFNTAGSNLFPYLLAPQFGDIDGDGDIDMVTSEDSQYGLGSVFKNNGSGTYSVSSTFLASGMSGTSYFRLGDLDGDGDLDLMLYATFFGANGNDPCLQGNKFRYIGLNNGSGAFTLSREQVCELVPFELVDVDNDGDLDMVERSGTTLRIRSNNGAGAFPTTTEATLPFAPSELVAGDLDGDTAADLVLLSATAGTATPYFNNGTGTFAAGTALTLAAGISTPVLADANGDGHLDLWVPANSQLLLALNNGSGSFGAATPTALPATPSPLQVADFDRDGDLDFVAASAGKVVAYRNASLPTITGFTPTGGAVGASVALTGTNLGCATSVSFNGTAATFTIGSATQLTTTAPAGFTSGPLTVVTPDGTFTTTASFGAIPALLTFSPTRNARAASRATSVALTFSEPMTNATAGNLRVFSGRAGGRKAGTTTVAGATITFVPSIAFKPGETVSVSVPSSVQSTFGVPVVPLVYQFTAAATGGSGLFAGGADPTAAAWTRALATADVDGDGDLDLVTAAYGPTATAGNQLTICLNDGAGGFSATTTLTTSNRPLAVAVGDMDGDGDLDLLVAASAGGEINRFFNNGTGTFSGATAVSVSGNPQNVVLADVDGDRDLDLVATVANGTNGYVLVRPNNGSGVFGTTYYYAVGQQPTGLAVGDLDSDGDLDVVVANTADDNVTVLPNDGTGALGPNTTLAVGDAPVALALADMDGDGDLDLLCANTGTNDVSLLLNDGDGLLGNLTSIGVAAAPQGLALGDVDGDGDLDLVTSSSTTGTVSVRLNSGSGTFSGTGAASVSATPYGVVLADLDGDNDLDLATASWDAAGTVSVRFNQDGNPVVTSFTPTSGAAGTTVTVTGLNLAAATAVRLGEVVAPVTAASYTSATFVVPRLASTHRLTVSTLTGQAVSSSSFAVPRNSSLTYELVTTAPGGYTASSFAHPTFGDLDHDGLLDMLVGTGTGTIVHYEQTAASAPTFTQVSTNFNAIGVPLRAAPTLTDLDGDGLYDLLVGTSQGRLYHYEQNAANSLNFTIASSSFNSINVLVFAEPVTTDLDGDGLIDLLIGNGNGAIHHYEQAAAHSLTFNLITAAFASLNFGTDAVPSIADIDGDGQLDLLVGNANGQLRHYEQTAPYAPTVALVTAGFNGFDVGLNAAPAFTDLDQDGLLDMIVGENFGKLYHYEQVDLTPTLTSLTPASGALGETVTLTGTFLNTATAVSFGGTAALAFTAASATSLTATVPAGLASGAVSITVTTPAGTTNALTYTVVLPTLAGFSPPSGPVGTLVTLTGTNLSAATSLSFNGTAALGLTAVNNTTLTATVPATATTGTLSVSLPSGTLTTTGSFTVTPTLTAFSPSSGGAGVSVVITGTTLAGATAVTFNNVAATSFTVNSATQLTAVVPASATTGLIRITTPDGTAISATSFVVLPTLSGFTPASGPVGTVVTLNGTALLLTTGVSFNGTPAAGFTTISATEVRATAPAGTTTGPITLTTTTGPVTTATNFTLTPGLTAFSPASGPAGASVLLTVANLTGATGVQFNGVSATFTVNSATQLTAIVPTGASPGPITVTTAGGTGTSTASFTVTLALTAVTPARNQTAVARTTNIGATFNEPVAAATAGNVRVFSAQQGGRRSGATTSGGNSLTFDPTLDFRPGETVSVTVPAGITSVAGAPAAPHVHQFTAAAGVAPGGFGVLNTLTTGGQTAATTLADLDGDGDLDLATIPASTSELRVQLNDGAAGFGAATAYALGNTPADLTAADIDNDGDLDLLVVTFAGTDAVSVLRNTGTGTFVAAAGVLVGAFPGRVLAADVNADGWLDLVALNRGSSTASVSVALNLGSGAGTFAASTTLTLPGTVAQGLAVGDLDHDGDLDLAVGDPTNALVRLLLNNGAGTFSVNATTVATGLSPAGVVLADLNNDQRLDLITANNGTTTLSVALATGAATFGAAVAVAVPSGPYAVAAADVDGDGDLDLVTTHNAAPGSVSVRLNNGSGAFSGNNSTTVGNGPQALALGDLNGDLTLDLITANRSSGSVSVLLNVVPPVITAFSPVSGPEGTLVSISGTGLGNTTAVAFNGASAVSFTVVSATLVTATVPVGATTGTISLTSLGSTDTSPAVFTVTPTLVSFTPASGPAGTSVVITGTALAGATGVSFNGTAAASFTVNSATQLTAVAPMGVTTGFLTISTPSGASTSATVYGVPPTLSGFTPGSATAGTVFTVTGLNLTGTTAVSFNGTPAAAFTVVSATQVQATLPLGTASGTISLTTPYGTVTTATDFTLIPQILSFSPASGPVGTQVYITGDGLTGISGATAVKVNGTNATSYTVTSSQGLNLRVGSGTTTGPITIVTSGGTLTSATDFVVNNSIPTIYSLSPTSGPVGTGILVAGQFLAGASFAVSSATVNGVAATFTRLSGTSIRVTVPPTATGTGYVTLTNSFGTSQSGQTFTVTPALTAFTPASGPVGTFVTLTGTTLGDATALTLNGVALPFTVVNATTLTMTIPAGATSGTFAVTTPNGTGTTATAFIIPPIVTAFAPLSGVAGTVVTISGSGFAGATGVTFNGVAASSFLVVSATEITATVPAGTSTGVVGVSVAGSTALSAASFGVSNPATAFAPVRHALAAGSSTNVGVTFTEPVTAASAASLQVFSSQRGGRKAGTTSVSGNALSFDPTTGFQPGETVQVTVPATVLGAGGAPTGKQVYQFTAAAGMGTGTFTTSATLATGNDCTGATLADLDGDGDLDMATANRLANTVTVRFNDGTGTYGAANPYAVTGPWGVTAADVDEDGDLDLLAAGGTNVTVLLNTNGTFAAGAVVTVGSSPRAVVAADLNGDGHLDLLTPNASSASVSISLGTGAGTFGAAVSLSVGGTPVSLAVGDFDLDGDLDLVVTDFANLRARVALNDGSGTFALSTDVTTGLQPSAVALTDLNADGILDLLTANAGSNSLTLALGTGAGDFSLATGVLVNGASRALTTADVDGDGDLDIVAANYSNATVSIRLNDGSGAFSGAHNPGVGSQPYGIAVGDVDGDGDLDLLTANRNAATATLLRNTEAPTITGFAATSGLAGSVVTISGTGFTAAMAVRFNGTSAGYVVVSSTSLTATVPATATTGTLSVTTPGGTATSAASFTVLQVFSGTLNQCLSTGSISSTGSGEWQYLLAGNGQVVAALNDGGQVLGTVSAEFTLASLAAVRADGLGREYLDRNWHLMAQNTFAGHSVQVRFYGLNMEWARYLAANDGDGNDVTTLADLRLTQYAGVNENCALSDNQFLSASTRLLTPSATDAPTGGLWFSVTATVPDHFSEFYLNGGDGPLPVELTRFTARRTSAGHVLTEWATASEKNAAGFVVERAANGRSFVAVSDLLPGAGTSTAPHPYAWTDGAAPAALIYYRLRQVDLDGTTYYSAVVAVAAGAAKTAPLTVWPNPAHAAVTVNGAVVGTAVEVVDATGRVVRRVLASASGEALVLPVAGLPAGLYTVRNGAQVQRLIVE